MATLSFATVLKAEDIALPVISKPAILDEGTQRELSAAQIAELLPWAKDSKLFLTDLLDNIQGLSTTDKIDRLVEGLQQVVGESAPKNSELLMRYALNRGLVINEILSKEMSDDVVGTADAKLRVLKSSIQMAIKYYDTDMAILAKKTVAPYVIFGLDYFEFLTELNKSVFDASAQYAIQRTAFEWLQWDLYRDLNNAAYAPQIVKINNSLKTFSNKKLTDAQSIASIRQMKKIAQQLNVSGVLAKLEEERRLSAAKSEEERRMLIAKTQEEKDRIQREAMIEKMRGVRSAIDIEKVNTLSGVLNSNQWTNRLDAAAKLGAVVGGDVTLMLLDRYLVENDSDVNNSLLGFLNTRFGNNLYLMKTENSELQNKKIIDLISSRRPNGWDKRMYIANLLGKIATVESYRLLTTWLNSENDSDARNSINSSMQKIEQALNK